MIQFPTRLYGKKERLNDVVCGALVIIGASLVITGLTAGSLPITLIGASLCSLAAVISK